MIYYDAHLHLVPDDILENAKARGLKAFFMNARTPGEWDSVLSCASKFGGYACLGVHPWFVEHLEEGWKERLEQILKQNENVMIGEVGLDRLHPAFDKQQKVFEKCLELALTYHRAIHIHCVRAWDVMEHMLKGYLGVCLFHGFKGNEQIVKALPKSAYFSGNTLLKGVPESRVLIESDAPDGLKNPAEIAALAFFQKNETILIQNMQMFLKQALPRKSLDKLGEITDNVPH